MPQPIILPPRKTIFDFLQPGVDTLQQGLMQMAQLRLQQKFRAEERRQRVDDIAAQRKFTVEQDKLTRTFQARLAGAKASGGTFSIDGNEIAFPVPPQRAKNLLDFGLVESKGQFFKINTTTGIMDKKPVAGLNNSNKTTKIKEFNFAQTQGFKGSFIDFVKATQKAAVQIFTGDLSKTTRAQVEKDIIQGVRSLGSFKKTRTLFKPEYLTVFGKGEVLLAKKADQLGLSSVSQKRLIRERATWFRRAKADFIAYRKWATGVAGGEKELKEIATAFPDPVKNTPEQYQANLDSIEDTTVEILKLNREFLDSGINFNQPSAQILQQAQSQGFNFPKSANQINLPTDQLTPMQEAQQFLNSLSQ